MRRGICFGTAYIEVAIVVRHCAAALEGSSVEDEGWESRSSALAISGRVCRERGQSKDVAGSTTLLSVREALAWSSRVPGSRYNEQLEGVQ